MTVAREPSPALAAHPLRCAFLATRPAFLSVTALAVLLGLACAWHGGAARHWVDGWLTLVFALAAHAGVNVVNDYHDARNGTDAANSERLFPFTGGSRFIQNGVWSAQTTGIFGYLLLLSVIPPGLWLMRAVGMELSYIGVAGLFLGWAYSAPPCQLASRGLGELAVAGGWTLVVVGSDFVQRRGFALPPLLAGLSYGLMVASLLYVNQFPDARADAHAGKRTVVVRCGRRGAVRGYAIIVGGAGVLLLLAIGAGVLPWAAAFALLALLPAGSAYRCLRHHAETPAALLPAIKATLLATHLFGALLAAAIAFA